MASATEYQHAPKIKIKAGTSSNWAGYSVDAQVGSVTDVKGSWIVPSVASSTQNQYSSFWVGIDGDTSNTVEQIGTDSDVINGVPRYYAWYEFYPKASSTISSMQVKPGDTMSADVSYSKNQNIFTVTITDVTTGKSYSTSARVNKAQRNSAEWITEAPWSGGVLPLADFTTANFGQDYTNIASNIATISGTTGNIHSFGTSVNPITMVSKSGGNKAVPTGLSSDGTSFSVNWFNAGP